MRRYQPPHPDLPELIVSARNAAGRARAAWFAYLVFGALALLSFANVYALNWSDVRMRVLTLATALIDSETAPVRLGERVVNPAVAESLAKHWAKQYYLVRKQAAQPAEQRERERAAEVALRTGWDSTYVNQELRYLQEFRRENVLSLPVPFIEGTALRVDVNAMGLLFAAGLAVFLLLVQGAVHRERVAFELLAKRAQISVWESVLLDSTFWGSRRLVGKLAVSVALLVPMAVACHLFYTDWQSREFGALFSGQLVATVLWGEVGSLLVGAVAGADIMRCVWRGMDSRRLGVKRVVR